MNRKTTPATPAAAPAPIAPPKLIPITEWPQYHPYPPVGGLRWIAFNADSNGFASAFVRIGRLVLVDEREFFRIVELGRAAKPHPTRRPKPQHLPRPVEVLDDEAA